MVAFLTRLLMVLHSRDRDPRSSDGTALHRGVTVHVERLIGSIRHECLDHVIVFGEARLRQDPQNLRPVLQRGPDPSVIGQGRCGRSARATGRQHRHSASLGRAAS